jgi:hypothetical protein
MPQGASAQQVLMTVAAAVIVSSLAAGIFMTALGAFKLGGLIRFIPYPAIRRWSSFRHCWDCPNGKGKADWIF